MRNYETEIQELTEEIQELNMQRTDKERALKQLVSEQRRQKKSALRQHTLDKERHSIRVGNWVITTTKGKFARREGTFTQVKQWVTFEDVTGVKEVRASHNVIIRNHDRKHAQQSVKSSSNRYKK